MEFLKKRQEEVLRAIIQNYIKTGKPVASKKLVECCGLNLSPASIRIIMAEMEELGYIWQPYTSAGRIPTDKGYRFYVDRLMKIPGLERKERNDILSLSRIQAPNLDDIIKKASELLSEFTHYTSLILVPSERDNRIRHLKFIPLGKKKILAVLVTDAAQVKNRIILTRKQMSDKKIDWWNKWLSENLLGSEITDAGKVLLKKKSLSQEDHFIAEQLDDMFLELKILGENEPVYFAGNLNVFDQPEFDELKDIKSFFSLLDSKKKLARMLNPYLDKRGIQVVIGGENDFEELENFSMITSPCRVSNRSIVLLAVIGPKRMYYSRVISLLDFTAKILGNTLDKIYEESEDIA